MPVTLTVEDHVAEIVMDRPERLNAMDTEMYDQLSQCWTRVRDDDEIRVAVITGAGDRSFSVGADLKSWATREQPLSKLWHTQDSQLLNRGLEVWKPVVAAVNGYCLGGGMTLLLATDIRIAARGATFAVPEVKRGLLPANGGTQRLLRQLPYAVAMHLLLTGRSIDAETAERWGLVNQVVEPEELLVTARTIARELAEAAPLATQAAKELALRSADVDLATGLRAEQLTIRHLYASEDAVEGARAFRENRPPQFRGR